ncbi:MAG: 2-oxoacid:acceptor oxidoreductase family protein [Chloroflexi bacterium]|nr:2-oxoacid:acceptor oxidoreductase family protein [Chloroflexota bacterium]
MQEISLYGLGGQGVVVAAHLLTSAAGVYEGRYAQSIPAFTPEQRGAPVYAHVRLSDEPILPHSYIYKPDCIVSFLWNATPWAQLIHKGQRPVFCVANLPHSQSPELFKLGLCGGFLDANAITQETFGTATPPNAAMLGAFAATTGWIGIGALVQAILAFWPGERGERNALVARRAFKNITKF